MSGFLDNLMSNIGNEEFDESLSDAVRTECASKGHPNAILVGPETKVNSVKGGPIQQEVTTAMYCRICNHTYNIDMTLEERKQYEKNHKKPLETF